MPSELRRRSHPPVSIPRGSEISCKSWQQEAALRMLMNTVEAGERPATRPQASAVAAVRMLGVATGGSAVPAARDWDCYDAIVRSLQSLANDETLLIQSGKPVAIFRTHEWAPRVLIANANLNPPGRPSAMYSQLSAGSWIHTGSQGIISAMFETLLAVAGQHFGGELAGKLVVSGGMGDLGGAQSMAATMAGACFLGIEVDAECIKRRLRSGYVDFMVNSLDEALRILKNALRKKENVSVGLIGNCADVLPELAERGVLPDVLTDQTSAHDPLNGYVPNGMPLAAALELRRRDPKAYQERALAAIARHVEAMLRLEKMGAVTFDSGHQLRASAFQQGVSRAYDIPGADTYLRPLVCQGRGPLRWLALSSDAADIAATDDLALEMFPQERALQRWITVARRRLRFEALPARVCWLGNAQRVQFALAINDLVRHGKIKAPIVIASDQLDCACAGSPFAESENIRDGSDAIADWPWLSALLGTASGAAWVSLNDGGGTAAGHSLHAGQATLADGTEEAARRIERVLANDAGFALARFADAGCDEARASARHAGIRIPMEKV